MKQLIDEIKALAIDLKASKDDGDDYDVWCITNMIEARRDHLKNIFCGRC